MKTEHPIYHTHRNPRSKPYEGTVFTGESKTDPSFVIDMHKLVDTYLRLPPEERPVGQFDLSEHDLSKLDRLELTELTAEATENAAILVAETKAKAKAKAKAAKMKKMEPDASDFDELVPDTKDLETKSANENVKSKDKTS